MTQQRPLKRSVGLAGAVLFLVGYIVGASIFILPGELAASTGPGLFVSYLIAGSVALFACVVTAQVASAFPTSGANYVSVSRVLSPFWGFMLVWITILANAVGNPLIAYGFAEYLAYYFPGINLMLTAIVVFLLFTAINLLGIAFANWVQVVLIGVTMAVLLVFGIGGLSNAQPDLLTPLFPLGLGAVAVAAIPAYFSYAGFIVIAELGDEIKSSSRNIPLALGITFVVLLVTYTLVPLALTGLVPYDSIGDSNAALAVASESFLPGWFVQVIILSALFAAATSINGSLMAQARSFLAVARDDILPSFLTRVDERFRIPYNAVLLTSVLSIGGILVGTTIENYAIVTVLCFMVFQILVAIAVLRLPRRMPELFGRAAFKLSRLWRLFFSVGLIVTSALFILVGLSESLFSAVIFFGFSALGPVYYFSRRMQLKRRGMDLEAGLRQDPEDSATGHQTTNEKLEPKVDVEQKPDNMVRKEDRL